MHRRALTFVLSFFLLFMQQETARHALDHLGAQLQRIEHSALEQPTGDHCSECDLLASGTATPQTAPFSPGVDAPDWLVVAAPIARVATAAPIHYYSRAPPARLRLA
jgi:hypothetical protein